MLLLFAVALQGVLEFGQEGSTAAADAAADAADASATTTTAATATAAAYAAIEGPQTVLELPLQCALVFAFDVVVVWLVEVL